MKYEFKLYLMLYQIMVSKVVTSLFSVYNLSIEKYFQFITTAYWNQADLNFQRKFPLSTEGMEDCSDNRVFCLPSEESHVWFQPYGWKLIKNPIFPHALGIKWKTKTSSIHLFFLYFNIKLKIKDHRIRDMIVNYRIFRTGKALCKLKSNSGATYKIKYDK